MTSTTPTPPAGDRPLVPSDFSVGDYVQRVGRSASEVFRIDRVHDAVPWGHEGQAFVWEYDVTYVTGAYTGDSLPRVAIYPNQYRKVTDPDIANTIHLTRQQRQIYDAADVLLFHLENNLPDNTAHWLAESLKIDLAKLLNYGNASSNVYARRTAYVGNWPTADKEN